MLSNCYFRSSPIAAAPPNARAAMATCPAQRPALATSANVLAHWPRQSRMTSLPGYLATSLPSHIPSDPLFPPVSSSVVMWACVIRALQITPCASALPRSAGPRPKPERPSWATTVHSRRARGDKSRYRRCAPSECVALRGGLQIASQRLRQFAGTPAQSIARQPPERQIAG